MTQTPTKCAPAFDFYPERWTHGTRHMTKTERCDYLDLLCHQWTENGLPDDLDMIGRLLGYKKPTQIPPLVLEKFPKADDGRRRNKRLEDERTKQIARIEKKRCGAAITNQKRWGERPPKPSLSDQIATPERVDVESPPPTSDLRSPKGEGDDAIFFDFDSKPRNPLPFDSPEFADAWKDWQTHRKEIRKPLKPTMTKGQLQELAAMGEQRAITCIRHTIRKGWTGLREPDSQNGHRPADETASQRFSL